MARRSKKRKRKGGVEKSRLTINLPVKLIERVKNAVYWTPGLTMSSLSEMAFQKVIDKLEKERGAPFAHRKAELKPGRAAPSPRTIQRIRKRNGFPRVPQPPAPQSVAKLFTKEEKSQVDDYLRSHNHLGALRLSWDITNILAIPISASTVFHRRWQVILNQVEVVSWRFYERKHPHSLWHGDCMNLYRSPDGTYLNQLTILDDYSRGYLFCDLTDQATDLYTVQCLIRAMKRWEVIPKAVVFDNGAEFKGKLLKFFCRNLGIQLIHTSVRHPQTNGKLERAFRDDRRDFYGLRKGWSAEALKQALPGYVHYRNYQRGHWALKGRPAITRLREQNWIALPVLLDRLEEYVEHEIGRKTVDLNGYVRILTKPAYVGKRFKGAKVRFFETLNGLEIRKDNEVTGVIPDYYRYRRMGPGSGFGGYSTMPIDHFVLKRSRNKEESPRIAVAL